MLDISNSCLWYFVLNRYSKSLVLCRDSGWGYELLSAAFTPYSARSVLVLHLHLLLVEFTTCDGLLHNGSLQDSSLYPPCAHLLSQDFPHSGLLRQHPCGGPQIINTREVLDRKERRLTEGEVFSFIVKHCLDTDCKRHTLLFFKGAQRYIYHFIIFSIIFSFT